MSVSSIALTQSEIEQRSFITKVYWWMSSALLITGLVALFTVSTPSLINVIFGNNILFFGLIIGEIGLVVYISRSIGKMSAQTATFAFIGYSVLNGLTLSVIFLIYTATSIASTFFITAGTFGIMSIYGYFTKRDLTSIGGLLTMALIGVIIAMVVNMFLNSDSLSFIISIIGVLVFVGLTAYDTQKIKKMSGTIEDGTEMATKAAIMGALALYLDFINLFLFFLRLMGNRR